MFSSTHSPIWPTTSPLNRLFNIDDRHVYYCYCFHCIACYKIIRAPIGRNVVHTPGWLFRNHRSTELGDRWRNGLNPLKEPYIWCWDGYRFLLRVANDFYNTVFHQHHGLKSRRKRFVSGNVSAIFLVLNTSFPVAWIWGPSNLVTVIFICEKQGLLSLDFIHLSCFVIDFFLPETKGRSLEELDE